MGAWQHIVSQYYRVAKLNLIARKESASPATGFKKVHDEQQKDIVNRAFE
jgi:2-oxoglutarate dehydrogenase complex, dehydrogenase (E1) component, and related enzymes